MSRVLKILGFLALVLVANWPYVYEEVLSEPFGMGVQLFPGSVGISSIATSRPLPPTFAGWPFKFYQSIGAAGELRVASFKWSAMLLTICFWSLVPLAIVLYEQLIFRKRIRSDKLEFEEDDSERGVTQESPNVLNSKLQRPNKPKRRSLQLADIFVVTALIAGVFGFWQTIRKRGELDKKLATEVTNKGGGAKRSAMLPWIASELLRVGGHAACLRTTEVRLVNPDDALLAKVVALPYLRTLNIAGGNYDFRTLNHLSTNPLFTEIGIVGRPLNADAIAAIRSMQSLRKLNLMRTNITAAGVAAIGQPRLLELNLVHTDVQLSELGSPAFAKTLKKLSLPHPRKGGGDSLRLEDWPELVELSCYEYDELLNREPVALILKNLPKLTTVELDGLQMFNVDFEQLPSLTKFEPTFLQWEQRTTPQQVVPSFVWAGRLRIKNVPNLKELSIFCADTQSIDIDQESMTLGLCVFNKGAGRSDRTGMGMGIMGGSRMDYSEPGYLTHADIPLATRQNWIDDLAKCHGLQSVDLELVPLKGVKLHSLVANKSIRQLKLGKSGVASSQLSELKGMDQLEELSLVAIPVDGRAVEWLAKTLPNLRKITCEPFAVQRLRLEHIPNLESIFEKPQEANQNGYSPFMNQDQSQLDALRIVDAPRLKDHFVTHVPLLFLHIESAPALAGLSFQEPLPVNAIVKGVRDLKFFAAGGPSCTDSIVNEVLNCAGMRRLTLAYTELLPATIQRIAELRELEYLVLTGTKIDDHFLASLAGLEKLRTLRLDQITINNASISTLSKLKNLEVLDLGELSLTSEEVTQLLPSLTKLKRLTLVGAELTADNMRQIAKLSSLQSLDLSNCELSDELLNAFAESAPQQLSVIQLNSAMLGEVGFKNLVQKLRNARFTLKGSNVNPQLLDVLVMQNRATEFDGDEGDMAMGMSSGTGSTIFFNGPGAGYGRTLQIDLPQLGDIDPLRFAPNYQDPRAEFESRTSRGSRLENGAGKVDGLDEDLGALTGQPLGPPMTAFESFGYGLFKVLNGLRAPVSIRPDNVE